MARVARALFFIALLLCSTLASAARPEPAFQLQQLILRKNNLGGVETEQVDIESCEGVGEEECLMRRTWLPTSITIYTQKTKP
ncbi:hypothetical protein M0R45_001500 [Rubus argutus]|uniref:Phytosulfokine n=1 Tax=Rubus argutus TaxID=59490 RepID=A0AAW1VM45_RUBAR